MKCDELTPIELECNMGKDSVTGLVNREPWKAYDIDEVDAAIAELKAENERLKKCEIWMKQHFFCEEVIACESAKNRQLRRALWLARAERAEAEQAHWATIWFCDTKIVLNINKSSVSQDPYKSNTFKKASEWRNMWYDIASKCLKKAEELK